MKKNIFWGLLYILSLGIMAEDTEWKLEYGRDVIERYLACPGHNQDVDVSGEAVYGFYPQFSKELQSNVSDCPEYIKIFDRHIAKMEIYVSLINDELELEYQASEQCIAEFSMFITDIKSLSVEYPKKEYNIRNVASDLIMAPFYLVKEIRNCQEFDQFRVKAIAEIRKNIDIFEE